MSVRFTVERWGDLWLDAQDIFPIHFAELSLEPPGSMDFDVAKYQDIENCGQLHVLCARDSGKLIGYYTAIFIVHPHYKHSGPMSSTDMFYILPEYRQEGWGAKLLMEAARTLKARGVKKAYIGTKLKQDHTKLLEMLGWEATDKMFSKIL